MNSKSCLHNRSRAFTRGELIIIAFLLGMLGLVAVPRLGHSAAEAKVLTCRANVCLVNSRMALQFICEGVWPKSLNKFFANTTYFPEDPPACPFGVKYELRDDAHLIIPHDH